MPAGIDVSFDFRSDAPPGRDPDTFSPTLGFFHELLWSKALPNGARFDLTASTPPVYLYHHSHLGEFWLSSDSVIHTYTRWESMRPITEQIPEAENESFRTIAYTDRRDDGLACQSSRRKADHQRCAAGSSGQYLTAST